MEQQPLMRPAVWEANKQRHINYLRNYNTFDESMDIEVDQDAGVIPKVKTRSSFSRWWDSPVFEGRSRCDSCLDCGVILGSIFSVCGVYGIACSLFIFVIHAASHNDISQDLKTIAVYLPLLCACLSPVMLRYLLLKIKARRHQKVSNAYVSDVYRFYENFFKDIENQDVKKVIEHLKVQKKVGPLDSLLDTQWRTPLQCAIDSANLKKDPQSKIIQDLIARGSSLWYDKIPVVNEISAADLEAGVREMKDAPDEVQPIIKMINNQNLHGILKALCRLATKALIGEKKKSNEQFLLLSILADRKS